MTAKNSLIVIMEKAARKAAVRLRRDFGEVEHLQVSAKGPADFVSNADRAAERTLREELALGRPTFGYVMEEGGEIPGADKDSPRFIIDPLDGTSNFLHGIPHFAISIAVEEKGEIVAGLVYQPLLDESFWAVKGQGAYLGQRKLRVSGRRNLHEALFATGMPYKGHGDAQQYSRILENVMTKIAGVRRFGAASLDLAWIAAGRFDGFWEAGLQNWDMAAGILLVREAGGIVTDYRGGQTMLDSGDIIAGNSALHADLHKLVAQGVRAAA